MTKRIECIDGWRAIAAVGVLYGHILGTLKTPSCFIFGIDILKMMNLWGYGVHLFFVISGFCFFLVLDGRGNNSFSEALKFWKKRWIRIAPAFYVSCILFALLQMKKLNGYFFPAIIANFLFIQPYIPHAEINAIYWSLSTEWIFYMVLPLLFFFIRKGNVYTVVLIVLFIGQALNILHYKGLLYPGDSWQYTFFANFEHFAWGILISFLFKNDIIKTGIINKKTGIVTGLLIAYLGKMLFTAAFVAKAGRWGFIFQSIGPLVMTFGFAWMILNSLNNSAIFKIIGNKIFVFIGRISYSFYLWHTLILALVYRQMQAYFPSNIYGVLLLLATTLIILVPFSFLSYRLLEAFYFKRK
ncbi:MAG: acyltransferase [Bacteroidetes bacterium]|nr:acyltransferase [Bacteroidota bacterium]